MSKFIYKFENYADYLAVKDTLEIPSISYVKDLEVVINNGLDEVSSEMPERVATPVITFANNKFTVTCETPNVTIYYTIGTEMPEDPTLDSSMYSAPISIQESKYLKVIAVKYGMLKSYTAEEYGEYVEPVGNKIYFTGTDLYQPIFGIDNYNHTMGYIGTGDGYSEYEGTITRIEGWGFYDFDPEYHAYPNGRLRQDLLTSILFSEYVNYLSMPDSGNMENLESITILNPQMIEIRFPSSSSWTNFIPSTAKIYVPANLVNSYKAYWTVMANQIEPIQ